MNRCSSDVKSRLFGEERLLTALSAAGSEKPEVLLPGTTCRGDLICVCTTGAYNYSMASNYNRVPRPPIVLLRGEEAYIAVRRESYDDLTALDV